MTERLTEPGMGLAASHRAEREGVREREREKERDKGGGERGEKREEVANRRGGVNRCRAAEGRTSRWRETQPV